MSNCDAFIRIVPSDVQKRVESMGFYCFFHFGINTFTGKEWGDGTADPALFDPSDLDTDDWCRAVAAAGAKGVILTAKHHDGFCLWQTDTTDYCVRSSPWKNGKGDVVAMLADSCRKFGLAMGVYLSPWDRNSDKYGTELYDDFYCAQLTELLTRYGDMFTVWLDGACGSYLDGKPVQKYDFERYYALIRKLQPDCAISNCGPDVRWVGNEAGVTRPSEWNVVPAALADPLKVAENSQKADAPFEKTLGAEDVDLGSRAVLSKCSDLIWYPAEADVSIRPGWFYHSYEDRKVKSVDKLLSLWYKTVGGNCMLLLNVPPDKRGKICAKDAAVLARLGDRLRSAFAHQAPTAPDNALPEFAPCADDKEYHVDLRFCEPCRIDKVVIAEDIDFSQRIEKFALFADVDGSRRKLCDGTTVGHLKIALFDPVVCNGVSLVISECRHEPHLRTFAAYLDDGTPHPKERFQALKRFWTRLNYKLYLLRESALRRKNNKDN